MAEYAELYITDGASIVNLLHHFGLRSWRPKVAGYKGGGVYLDSPFADGRQLVHARFDNVVETIELYARGGDPDQINYDLQELRRLVEGAKDYWTSQPCDTPVWIGARARGETNLRYATIVQGGAPEDDDPYEADIAWSLTGVLSQGLTLVLERGHWLGDPPGDSSCVQISGLQGFYTITTETDEPAASADDVSVNLSTGAYGEGLGHAEQYLRMGNIAGERFAAGIRFPTVDIPQGAVILSAKVTLVAFDNKTGLACYLRAQGEAADSAAQFSTYANFIARTRTNAYVDWDRLPAWTRSVTYDTPDLTAIVQEIVDRAGWVSGNPLVIFLTDNGSWTDADRTAAAFDDTIYDPPLLTVTYTADENVFGRDATCNEEVYAANKHNRAQLTHVYVDDGGVFGSNLIGAALPAAFLPAVPAANDAVYFGIDTSVSDSGPFFSIIFDIGTGAVNVTITWEKPDGVGGWVALSPCDNTANFGGSGVCSIHFEGPIYTDTVNGITGHWVRARVSAAGASPSAPTQQNRDFYTAVLPYVEIAAAQVGGDLPALARIKLHNRSANAGGSTNLYSDRVIAGLRKVDRGADFSAYINLGNTQNPSGITVSNAGVSTLIADYTSPSGMRMTWTPGGVEADILFGLVNLNSTISSQYFGRFHCYLRCLQVGGSAGDISIYLIVTNASTYSGFNLQTDTLPTNLVSGFDVLDFGEVSLPPTDILNSDETLNNLYIALYGTNTNAASPPLWCYDLILIPVDEWAGDFYQHIDASNGLTYYDIYYHDLDPIGKPKAGLRSLTRRHANNSAVAPLVPVTPNEPILQANTRQRYWFFSLRNYAGALPRRADPAICHTVLINKVQRYLASRGSR